jgi:hypothetical protein
MRAVCTSDFLMSTQGFYHFLLYLQRNVREARYALLFKINAAEGFNTPSVYN